MQATRIGLDIAKNLFQVHGVDAHGKTVIRKRPRRAELLPFFAQLPPCRIGIEACAGSHDWARWKMGGLPSSTRNGIEPSAFGLRATPYRQGIGESLQLVTQSRAEGI
mgnify:CR=1 FL=1